MPIEINGIGRLIKNVEIETKKTKNGDVDFCRLIVAFDNGKDNDKNDRPATFLSFDCWGKTATNLAKYTEKGSLVNVKATVVNNNYEKDGQKVYENRFIANNVTYLTKKSESSKAQEAEPDLQF